MNEPSTAAVADLGIKNPPEAKPVDRPQVRVVRVAPAESAERSPQSERAPTGGAEDQGKNFGELVKIYQPAIKQFVGLVDSTQVKIIGALARRRTDRDNALEIAELARISEESKEALKVSGARILARRTSNEEAADYLVVAAVVLEISTGFAAVISELKKLENGSGK